MQNYIHKIEMVQRKAARFVFRNYPRFASVAIMLSKLNWQSLEKRRDDLMLHKIIDIPGNHILQISSNHTCSSSSQKFLHLPSRIDSFHIHFSPEQFICGIPDYIVETDNFNTFKSLL